MKKLMVLTCLLFTLVCATNKRVLPGNDFLNGTWIPIQQEFGGNQLPASSFQNQKLVILDTSYEFTAESVDKGVIKYNDDKMDIYPMEGVNTGKHLTAIYRLDSNKLTICYNLSGDNYPSDFDTKLRKGLFLSVFKNDNSKQDISQ